MASASWALPPGGELCSILILDICLRCDGPVSLEAAMENPCTRFFVLVPSLFLFSYTNFDNFCGSLRQLFFWISLSLCFSPFWWFRAEERHLSVMSRDRRRKRHPRDHQAKKNQAWTTGWHRLRAHSNDEFEAAVAEAGALHAHDELFSRHIEPEPAPEDPVDWAMAEASDDEDDAPMPDAPPEPELIDMPPAPAYEPRMSNLERCIALRLVYGAGPR